MTTVITAVMYNTYTENQKKIIDRLSQQLGRAVTLEDVAEVLDFEDRVTDTETQAIKNKTDDTADKEEDTGWGLAMLAKVEGLEKNATLKDFLALLARVERLEKEPHEQSLLFLLAKIEALPSAGELRAMLLALANKVDAQESRIKALET